MLCLVCAGVQGDGREWRKRLPGSVSEGLPGWSLTQQGQSAVRVEREFLQEPVSSPGIATGDYGRSVAGDGTGIERYYNPEGQRARGPEGQRARGPEGQRARGPGWWRHESGFCARPGRARRAPSTSAGPRRPDAHAWRARTRSPLPLTSNPGAAGRDSPAVRARVGAGADGVEIHFANHKLCHRQIRLRSCSGRQPSLHNQQPEPQHIHI